MCPVSLYCPYFISFPSPFYIAVFNSFLLPFSLLRPLYICPVLVFHRTFFFDPFFLSFFFSFFQFAWFHPVYLASCFLSHVSCLPVALFHYFSLRIGLSSSYLPSPFFFISSAFCRHLPSFDILFYLAPVISSFLPCRH